MDRVEQLVVGAENGDLAEVKAALGAGVDVNAQGPNAGALHMAAFGGHTLILKALLKAGADTEIASAQGFTALHLAASTGQAAVAKALVKAGASLDARTPAGGTPLHVALASRHLAVARALVSAGGDLTAKDAEGRTLLHTAAASGSTKAVALLIKAGADLEAVDKSGDTPLRDAILAGFGPKKQLKSWSTQGSTNGVKVEYRIDHGLLRFTKGTYGPHPLPLRDQRQIARLSWAPPAFSKAIEHVDTALALLKAGADPMRASTAGNNGLHAAAELGDPRLLKALKRNKDLDWDVRNAKGTQALHFAARSHRPDGLALVLDASSEVNSIDSNGYTPLHFAADVGAPDALFKALLGAGADRSAKTGKPLGEVKAGATPAEVAAHWKDDAAATLLRVS